MYDVSVFMQELKKRFTWWYNRRVGRKGPLWEDRFKSVLVENDEKVLLMMAAHIDLNPVRAGLVKDPKDYRWSGYGEVVVGKRECRLGLMKAFGSVKRGEVRDGRSWKGYQAFYRKYLYGAGEASALDDAAARKRRGAHAPKAVAAVTRADGPLGLEQVVRVRLRYFTESVALGSEAWVEEVFERNRKILKVEQERGARVLKAPGVERSARDGGPAWGVDGVRLVVWTANMETFVNSEIPPIFPRLRSLRSNGTNGSHPSLGIALRSLALSENVFSTS
jgi:hypothetical protein